MSDKVADGLMPFGTFVRAVQNGCSLPEGDKSAIGANGASWVTWNVANLTPSLESQGSAVYLHVSDFKVHDYFDANVPMTPFGVKVVVAAINSVRVYDLGQ